MIVNKSKGWVSKPHEYEYIDSTVLDGKEIHCKFDIGYVLKNGRYLTDGDGLWLTESVVDGKNIVDELSEKDIETLTQYAEEVFMNEYYADYETDRLEYLRDMNQER